MISKAITAAFLFISEALISELFSLTVSYQLNSLVHSIAGDNAEARRIQEEACQEAYEPLLDGFPGVGHVKSGIHAALGDEEKARQVALSKFLVFRNIFEHFDSAIDILRRVFLM